ncbi:F-box domain-containing protein [Caenorhabditis elegans]|uniref:F-box domain-containing protein n=1 Tax=Caenorhabditis elegans TaxID=6239 RepID=O45561_CAEEL|nr:F-box domain-containing protein [Caenorhabditis elegans]CAB07625.1 F-box domain-containing protein [Caenorhabditis elegans]|eukprot:NP_506948.1 F-box A protein [Caenorhabditis elegans]
MCDTILMSKSLLDMPLLVVNLILEKSELIDRMNSRNVCKSLRQVVDKCAIRCGKIILDIEDKYVSMHLDGNKIVYTDADDNCTTVTYNDQENEIEGETFLVIALNDLKVALKHVSCFAYVDNTLDRYQNITYFKRFLKSEETLHVEEVEIWNSYVDDVMTILRCCDSEVLKDIGFSCSDMTDQFPRIAQLDQYKKAKRIRLKHFVLKEEQIENLFHLEEFEFEMDELSVQTAVKIRDNLLQRSTFRRCEIDLNQSNSRVLNGVANVFKPDYNGDVKFEVEYSNDNYKFVVSLGECKFYPSFLVFWVKKV